MSNKAEKLCHFMHVILNKFFFTSGHVGIHFDSYYWIRFAGNGVIFIHVQSITDQKNFEYPSIVEIKISELKIRVFQKYFKIIWCFHSIMLTSKLFVLSFFQGQYKTCGTIK